MAKIDDRVRDKVFKEIARIMKTDVSKLTRETRFEEDLHVKSLNIVEFIAILENEFQVMIPYAETRRRKTLGEAIDLVVGLRKA